jgi:hypothetical protein
MGFLRTFLASVFSPSKAHSRGAEGEIMARLAFSLHLPSEYTAVHNITLTTPKGSTQIDHVIVSRYGIHVVESKNVQGSIYGSAEQKQWTVFLGGKKFSLQNPLIQNKAHIKALAAHLGRPESQFHSVVLFWAENCRFKTEMPDNVRVKGLVAYIQTHKTPLLSNEEVQDVLARIELVRMPDTGSTDKAHVKQLRDRFHTQHKAGEACPQCEGILVQRNPKAGGQPFLGCSNYPKCRYVQRGT